MNFIKTISPVQKINFNGFEFYIKRDDLLGEINGNKARKLAFYIHQRYPKNQSFVSYGGSQSNALAALSIFAKQRSYKLVFACEKISTFLKNATTNLDQIRADIGSVQNQLQVTINNITVTQVNVKAAESTIRDVDFAAESANFSKYNILAQSGSYAMSQANAVQQNVLKLLQ